MSETMTMTFPEEFDTEKLAEMAMAMLFLSCHADKFGTRAWKSLDWGVMDMLHERGWIGDPKNKAKSVDVTEEGARAADEFIKKYFHRIQE